MSKSGFAVDLQISFMTVVTNPAVATGREQGCLVHCYALDGGDFVYKQGLMLNVSILLYAAQTADSQAAGTGCS